jgi:hypothetical protein
VLANHGYAGSIGGEHSVIGPTVGTLGWVD